MVSQPLPPKGEKERSGCLTDNGPGLRHRWLVALVPLGSIQSQEDAGAQASSGPECAGAVERVS